MESILITGDTAQGQYEVADVHQNCWVSVKLGGVSRRPHELQTRGVTQLTSVMSRSHQLVNHVRSRLSDGTVVSDADGAIAAMIRGLAKSKKSWLQKHAQCVRVTTGSPLGDGVGGVMCFGSTVLRSKFRSNSLQNEFGMVELVRRFAFFKSNLVV